MLGENSTAKPASVVSDVAPTNPKALPAHQRSHGRASISCRLRGAQTVLDDLYQHANAKVRIPKTYKNRFEAVFINTSGGIASGDSLELDIHAHTGTSITMTTQACERVYGRADRESAAHVRNSIKVESGAHLAWLPQETILFDNAGLDRSLTVDLSDDASFTAIETLAFGRMLMGEKVQNLHLRDQWNVSRNGVPLFADRIFLNGEISARLKHRFVLDGNSVVATVLHVPAKQDELVAVRATVLREATTGVDGVLVGVSAFDDKIVCRFVAADTYKLRLALPSVIDALSPGLALPSVWRV